MNNEEIEEIKRLLFQDRLTQYGKRKLVQYLEQKSEILDKVTDILKEDIDKYNKELLKDSIMSIKNTDLTARILQSQKILNIIEGEKNENTKDIKKE